MPCRNSLRGALALAALILCSEAHAGLFRAYLSGTGSDSNPCTISAPCRLLPAALDAVNSGGEIWMLDSANFNSSSVDIAKSVTIMAIPGEMGSLVAVAGPAVSIATANVQVGFRNVSFVPLAGAGGTSGISMTAGSKLSIEGCHFANLPGDGIFVNAAAAVRIVDTIVRDGGANGIHLRGDTRATISHVRVYGHGAGQGVWIDGTTSSTLAKATVSDSVVSENGTNLLASTPNGNIVGTAYLTITRTSIAGGGTGVAAQSEGQGAIVWIGASMLSGNNTSLGQFGQAFLVTFGNNNIADSHFPLVGSITTQAPN